MSKRNTFACIIAVAILLGVTCRTVELDRKQFFGDEAATALRVSGHTFSEFTRKFDGQIHTVVQVTTFQEIDPTRTIADTIHGLATEEPQHPPAFYVMERFWAGRFGSSITALRALPAIFGLLTLPIFFWLCLELFGSRTIAWTGTALMALSPFFVLYSAQAREYSLWAATICLSSVLLLRALRLKTRLAWIFYSIALIAMLYTYLLSVFVFAAHGLFVAMTSWRLTRVLRAFASSSAVAFVLFAPWLITIFKNRHSVDRDLWWGATSFPFLQMIEKWAFNIGAVFFDLEYANTHLIMIALAFLVLLGVATVHMLYTRDVIISQFVATLALVPALILVARDILTHGHFSLETRYLTPTWIVALLVVSMFFGSRLNNYALTWIAALAVVLAFEGASAFAGTQAVGWWNNNENIPITTIGRVIDKSSPASVLMIENGYSLHILELSHYVRPETRLLLFDKSIPAVTGQGFLFEPSKHVLGQFVQSRIHEVNLLPMESALIQGFHKSLKAEGVKLSGVPQNGYLYEVDAEPIPGQRPPQCGLKT